MSEEKVSHIKYAGHLWERVKEGSHSTRNVIDIEQKLRELESQLLHKDEFAVEKISELEDIILEQKDTIKDTEDDYKDMEAKASSLMGKIALLTKQVTTDSARLSHLMDAAGKMAGAIEAYQNCERASCFDCHKRMREARAEWDGIKKEVENEPSRTMESIP